MKKLLTIFLAMVMALSLAACGEKNTVADPSQSPAVTEPAEGQAEATPTPEADNSEEKEEKPTLAPTQKPAEKTETQKPTEKPSAQPSQAPTQTPAPTQAPTATPAPSTLGHTLLADFKAKATSGMGVQAIAESLLTNPAIKFSGGAMPVEEGLLSGFDNAEITGFKNGVAFMPMIGSIPFIGYVFELEDGADASAFIKNLEKNANRRWNICVEAEETVTGSYGNKVFFVMCPKALED